MGMDAAEAILDPEGERVAILHARVGPFQLRTARVFGCLTGLYYARLARSVVALTPLHPKR